jgi:hypothetical protein
MKQMSAIYPQIYQDHSFVEPLGWIWSYFLDQKNKWRNGDLMVIYQVSWDLIRI